MTTAVLYTLLVGLVAIERIAELVIAKRNLAWSLEQGGREVGSGHFPFMVALHTGLLAGCLLEVWAAHRPFLAAVGWPMLALVLGAQALRWWCIGSLGRQWNTRIVVVPQLSRVQVGPYRFVAHPNYVAVIVEGFALPLVHDAWVTALVFTVMNAALLRIRVRAENAALAELVPGAT